MTDPGAGARLGTRRRRSRLMEFLDGPEPRSIEDLAERLAVSTSTVRRDLLALEAEGELVRTLGGAVRAAGDEHSWHEKEAFQRDAKRAIARAAAARVPEGAVVLLDAGTTTGLLARVLAPRADLTLIVLGMSALVATADGQAKVVVPGGRLRATTAGFVGGETLLRLRSLTPDVAFVGCDGLDAERGINCPDSDVRALKQTVVEQARSSWVVADHTKLGRDAGFAYWLPLREPIGVITDSDPSRHGRAAAAYLDHAGARIVWPGLE